MNESIAMAIKLLIPYTPWLTTASTAYTCYSYTREAWSFLTWMCGVPSAQTAVFVVITSAVTSASTTTPVDASIIKEAIEMASRQTGVLPANITVIQRTAANTVPAADATSTTEVAKSEEEYVVVSAAGEMVTGPTS